MTKILIGALGFSDYKIYTYSFPDGHQVKSKFAVYAVAELIKPDQAIILLTEEAKTVIWEELQRELDKIQGMLSRAVDIPKGKESSEFWTIFERIVQAIPSDAEVILDITLGFRSIPILVLSVVSYLQAVKGVKISGIFYCAAEAVGREIEVKPIFDLSIFTRLQNWANAIEHFNRTGDSILLSNLLQANEEFSDPSEQLPKSVKQVALALKKLSLALDFVRPDDVMKASAKLQGDLRSAERVGLPQPFVVLLSEIRNQYGSLALHEPRNSANRLAYLERQYQIIYWYIRHERYLAAALLAREYVVSWYITHQGIIDERLFQDDFRENAKRQLDMVKNQIDGGGKLNDLSLFDAVEVWKRLPNPRNDLAHAGMRTYPSNAETLANNIRDAIERMNTLKASLP